MQVMDYSATEALRDGRVVEVCALGPEDRSGPLAAVDWTSEQSLYWRLFGFQRDIAEREVDFHVNVDFVRLFLIDPDADRAPQSC